MRGGNGCSGHVVRIAVALGLGTRLLKLTVFVERIAFLAKCARDKKDSSTNDSAPAREVLWKIVLLGTDRETAIAVLRRETWLSDYREPIADPRLRQRFLEARGLTKVPNTGRTRKDFVDCQTMSPNKAPIHLPAAVGSIDNVLEASASRRRVK